MGSVFRKMMTIQLQPLNRVDAEMIVSGIPMPAWAHQRTRLQGLPNCQYYLQYGLGCAELQGATRFNCIYANLHYSFKGGICFQFQQAFDYRPFIV